MNYWVKKAISLVMGSISKDREDEVDSYETEMNDFESDDFQTDQFADDDTDFQEDGELDGEDSDLESEDELITNFPEEDSDADEEGNDEFEPDESSELDSSYFIGVSEQLFQAYKMSNGNGEAVQAVVEQFELIIQQTDDFTKGTIIESLCFVLNDFIENHGEQNRELSHVFNQKLEMYRPS